MEKDNEKELIKHSGSFGTIRSGKIWSQFRISCLCYYAQRQSPLILSFPSNKGYSLLSSATERQQKASIAASTSSSSSSSSFDQARPNWHNMPNNNNQHSHPPSIWSESLGAETRGVCTHSQSAHPNPNPFSETTKKEELWTPSKRIIHILHVLYIAQTSTPSKAEAIDGLETSPNGQENNTQDDYCAHHPTAIISIPNGRATLCQIDKTRTTTTPEGDQQQRFRSNSESSGDWLPCITLPVFCCPLYRIYNECCLARTDPSSLASAAAVDLLLFPFSISSLEINANHPSFDST